eukprot:14509511-Ditylum_brightwellii.AAC.1
MTTSSLTLCKVSFNLKVSKEAEADQEFTDLLETTNDIIGDCKQCLKAQIVNTSSSSYSISSYLMTL